MEGVKKEMYSLKQMKYFMFHPPDKRFSKSNGWQFFPLHMFFDIKQQDMRFKARLTSKSNMVDPSASNTSSTTVQDIFVRFLMLITIKNELKMMTCNIVNSFSTALNMENAWTKAGP